MDDERGVIQYPERMRQLIEFRNFRFGTITPMDIDVMIEYHDKAYIFYEFKLEGASMPRGQKIALERLATDCIKAGKKAVVFLCEHTVTDAKQIVDGGNAIVKSVFFFGKWNPQEEPKTVSEWTRNFIAYVEKEKKGE